MRFGAQLSVLVVALALLAALPAEAKNPGRTCRICEDVAQTYHDAYRCAGESGDLWGPGDSPIFPSCDQPRFTCDKLAGDVREACDTMEQEFANDDESLRVLWSYQLEFGKAYDTCVNLGKCAAENEDSEDGQPPCKLAFQTPQGKTDILYQGFTLNCTEECYICNWLVREWPLFQEICTPEGARLASSIDPDRSIQKEIALDSIEEIKEAKEEAAEAGSAGEEAGGDAAFLQQHQEEDGSDVFLETSAEIGSGGRAVARSWAKHTNRAVAAAIQGSRVHVREGRPSPVSNPGGAGAKHLSAFPDGSSAEVKLPDGLELTGSDLKQDCFRMWRHFSKSRKAKFFLSWKRQLGVEMTPADVERSNNWDANIACKCMGLCALDPFEHLGLIKQCRYDQRDRTLMEYAFPKMH